MKRFFILIFILGFSSSVYAVEIEYQISPIHGLLNFVEAVSGNPHRTKSFKTLLQKSPYNTLKTKRYIARFKDLEKDLYRGVNYSGFPQTRKQGLSLDKIFIVQSGYAQSLKDLRQRTQSVLPLEKQKELFEILSYFEPLYKNLIWNKNVAKLNKYKERLKAHTKKIKFNSLFTRTQKFYKSTWPQNQNFTIALYPIPGKDGHSTAESIGAFESVGVIVDEKDLAGRFAVLFHELCHSLYEAQTEKFQYEFEKYFLQQNSAYAKFAYRTINEALATAIGNGWVYKKSTGQLDTSSWYNNKYIEGFARGLYPEVERYLNNNKSFDRRLAKKAVRIYQETFKDSIYEFDNLLNEVFISTDNRVFKGYEVREVLRSHFRVSSIYSSSPLNNPKTIENYKKNQATLFVVVSASNFDQLKSFSQHHGYLKSNIEQLRKMNRSSMLVGILNHRPFVIMKLQKKQDLVRAIEVLKEKKKMDAEAKIVIL